MKLFTKIVLKCLKEAEEYDKMVRSEEGKMPMEYFDERTGRFYVKVYTGGDVKVSKLDRIKELEKQLAELRKDVEREEVPSYPYVGYYKYSKEAVLFESDGIGTVISNRNGLHFGFGDNTDGWKMECFKPFTGAIHFKNGKPVKTVEEEN